MKQVDSFSSIIAREEILHHARSSPYRGAIENPSAQQKEHNIVCGDTVTVYVKLNDNVIEKMSFEGAGCAISQAATSLLVEYATGKHKDEIAALEGKDVESFLGGSLSPTRMKCGMLSLVALKRALKIDLK